MGWSQDVEIVACETEGAKSLCAAIEAKDLVTLPAITSIATSLGSKTVSKSVLDRRLEREGNCTFVRVLRSRCASGLRGTASYRSNLGRTSLWYRYWLSPREC